MINRILDFFEKNAFGVCAYFGSRLGLKTSKIRLFFIYLSFFTAGSPIIIYLGLAFLLEHKDYFKFKKNRESLWEL
jgi:phage shock protein C